MTTQCAEAIIGNDGFVVQCGREGGHKGNHVIVTDRGIAEWPRIEATPLADWERELICQHCGSSCCHRCDPMTPAPATVARCTTCPDEREK